MAHGHTYTTHTGFHTHETNTHRHKEKHWIKSYIKIETVYVFIWSKYPELSNVQKQIRDSIIISISIAQNVIIKKKKLGRVKTGMKAENIIELFKNPLWFRL